MHRPSILAVAACVWCSVAFSAEPVPKPAETVHTGKVKPLPNSPKSFVLDTGKEQFPLAETAVSRKLFLDAKLQNREVELTLVEQPGKKSFEVKKVYTVTDGKKHEVFYYCFNCELRAEEPGACKCCGADTVLVEQPLSTKK